MRFQIGLIQHIKSHLVIELIRPRCIGIMTGPNRVDVMFFHQAQVGNQLFPANRIAGKRVAVMPVNAIQCNILSVEIEYTVPDLNFSDPDFLFDASHRPWTIPAGTSWAFLHSKEVEHLQ